MSNGNSATFKFSITTPRRISLPKDMDGPKNSIERAEFYEWLWNRFAGSGLLGVHEGTLLCEEAVQEGLETESWTVDSGEAPRERDWVGHLDQGKAELYFASDEEATEAAAVLKNIPSVSVGSIERQEPQDWDAEWKASFSGAAIAPFWRVIPPWESTGCDSAAPGSQIFTSQQNHNLCSSNSEVKLKINPGAGFGTGTHETTQLCLQAIGEISQLVSLEKSPALDFGSGSGILSIGMALLGAEVDAVEIDPLAIDNARENASLNGVQDQVKFLLALENDSKTYSLVIANILRPVLLEYAEQLVGRLRPGASLVLSGLIESDVESVVRKYSGLLKSPPTQVYENGEWRAIVFVMPVHQS